MLVVDFVCCARFSDLCVVVVVDCCVDSVTVFKGLFEDMVWQFLWKEVAGQDQVTPEEI